MPVRGFCERFGCEANANGSPHITDPWTVVPYQSARNTGDTIMGANPRVSAVNKYLQSWDCHNLFTVGANVFAHNATYNPTGPVGALAYWTADAIKTRYMKNPGPLVSA